MSTIVSDGTLELERAKGAYEEGNLSGLVDGLVLCRIHRRDLPLWVHEGLAEVLQSYFAGSLEGKRWNKRWEKDMADLERYEFVEGVIEENKRLLTDIDPKGLASGPYGELLEREPRLRRGRRRSSKKYVGENRFRTAQKRLAEERQKNLSPHTIEASYKKVNRSLGANQNPYYKGWCAALLLARQRGGVAIF